MKLTKRQTLTIVFLWCAGLEILVCLLFQGPAVSPASAASATAVSTSDHRFSAEAAMAIHERVFPDRPHPAGTRENAAVREAIVDILQEHGWTVESAVPFELPASATRAVQAMLDAGNLAADGDPAGAGDVVNPGQLSSPGNIVAYRSDLLDKPTQPLLFVSHFDSCALGPGAGDAGGCVAALMEATRLLTRDTSVLQRPVWLLFTDAEEAGLVGASQFVETHPLIAQKPIVINMDARGTQGPVVMFESHAGNLQLIRRLVNHFRTPRLTGSLFTAIYRMLPNGTDFTVFLNAGCQGLNFALIDGAHRYHRPEDSRAHLDRRSVQHLGETALAIGRQLTSSGEVFDNSGDNQHEDALFFDLLGFGVLVVPLWWNFPLRFAILFIAVQIYGRPLVRMQKIGPVIAVWCTMAAVLPMMGGLGYVLSRSLIGTAILPVPFVAWGHWISGAFWLIALSVCSVWMHQMLRRHPAELVWNAFWLAHATTCMVVSIFLPEFSYLLSVPAVFAIVATLTMKDVFARTAVVTCLSAVLLIPLQHLVSISLGPAMGLMLLPTFSLLSMPLLPAFARQQS